MSDALEKIKADLTKEKTETPQRWDLGLSSGSTLLNLAASGRPEVGFLRGGMYRLVGDSKSGKSFLSLTCMAEAANNPKFDDYQLIFDNAENGALMDFERFFGKKMVERLLPPAGTSDEPKYSTTAQSFYYHLDDVLDNGPAIYVLDSMDALSTDEELDKFQESKKAYEKGKEVTGTFGTSKPKLNSVYVRAIFNKLVATESILIFISQTRANIGMGAMFNPKTVGGGFALTFYSSLEVWSSIKGHIKKEFKYRGKAKDREQGIICQLHVKKNRLTGRDRKVEIPIYHSSGIDDTGSIISFLVEEGRWEKTHGKIDATDLEFCGKEEELISYIEDNSLESELKNIAAQTWTEIEEAIEVRRKRRYL